MYSKVHYFCTSTQRAWFIRVSSLSVYAKCTLSTQTLRWQSASHKGEGKLQRQHSTSSLWDGKAGPQFVFLFALDCNVALTADISQPHLSPHSVFLSTLFWRMGNLANEQPWVVWWFDSNVCGFLHLISRCKKYLWVLIMKNYLSIIQIWFFDVK